MPGDATDELAFLHHRQHGEVVVEKDLRDAEDVHLDFQGLLHLGHEVGHPTTSGAMQGRVIKKPQAVLLGQDAAQAALTVHDRRRRDTVASQLFDRLQEIHVRSKGEPDLFHQILRFGNSSRR